MATEKRFVYYEHKGADYILENPNTDLDFIEMLGDCLDEKEIVNRLNELYEENNELNDENKKLKRDLKDYKKLAGKRLNKNRNHRAVIEDLGGSIRAYKGQISQLNEKIGKIQEAMEDTGALTKRQLEEILND